MNADHSLKTIDPFSSKYWEPLPVVHTTMDPPRLPLNTLKTNSSTVNVPSTHKPVKSFFTPASDLLKLNSSSQPHLSTHPSPIPSHSTSSSSRPTTTSLTANAKPKKLIPAEDMDDFKREVEGSNLSKIGLIEVLKKKFPGRSGAAIKSTLELVAKREGSKEADKRWVIVDESGVA
jgi:chromatin assembly factor 1 subunit A